MRFFRTPEQRRDWRQALTIVAVIITLLGAPILYRRIVGPPSLPSYPTKTAMVGSWERYRDGGYEVIVFREDGTYWSLSGEGRWTATGKKVLLLAGNRHRAFAYVATPLVQNAIPEALLVPLSLELGDAVDPFRKRPLE